VLIKLAISFVVSFTNINTFILNKKLFEGFFSFDKNDYIYLRGGAERLFELLLGWYN
jgi:hypothetical protein